MNNIVSIFNKNSENFSNPLSAFEYFFELGLIIRAINSLDSSGLQKIAEKNIHILLDHCKYGPTEEKDVSLDHLVNSYLM